MAPITIPLITDAHNRSAAQILLRWHMQHGIIAIPKSARPERMAENLDVFDFELDDYQMTAIDALDKGEQGRVGPQPRHLRRRVTTYALASHEPRLRHLLR
jgi:2,5-diketo-D-gluconate reductase A